MRLLGQGENRSVIMVYSPRFPSVGVVLFSPKTSSTDYIVKLSDCCQAGKNWYFRKVLIWISPIVNEVEHLFIFLRDRSHNPNKFAIERTFLLPISLLPATK